MSSVIASTSGPPDNMIQAVRHMQVTSIAAACHRHLRPHPVAEKTESHRSATGVHWWVQAARRERAVLSFYFYCRSHRLANPATSARRLYAHAAIPTVCAACSSRRRKGRRVRHSAQRLYARRRASPGRLARRNRKICPGRYRERVDTVHDSYTAPPGIRAGRWRAPRGRASRRWTGPRLLWVWLLDAPAAVRVVLNAHLYPSATRACAKKEKCTTAHRVPARTSRIPS